MPVLNRTASRFARARSGNVAMMFALVCVPLCLASLGAIDVFRAVTAKSQLQSALDAAALAAARLPANRESETQSVGERVFNANFKKDGSTTVDDLDFKVGSDGKVTGTVSAGIKPIVMGLLGGKKMRVGTSSQVVRAAAKLEVTMVLDNTGSMAGDKLENLKEAAKSFITTLEEAATRSVESDPVRISMVPFSHTVRVGSQYRHESWIDQNGASPVNNEIFTTASGTQFANRFTLLADLQTSWEGCVESRPHPFDIQDDAATTADPATLFPPFFWPDEPDNAFDKDYPNDYLRDRTNNSNWRVRQGSVSKYYLPTGSDVTSRYKRTFNTDLGPNKGCSMLPISRLTDDFDSLRDQVDDMVATGATNIPMGLMWGWHTLSPNAPFSDGVPYGKPKYKKVALLMTDGDNVISDVSGTGNRSNYSGIGYVWQGRIVTNNQTLKRLTSTSSSQSTRTDALDYRLQELCKNMKAKDIEIYTVRVEMKSGDSKVLRECASTANHYFDVQDASELDSVFRDIAGRIAALHLSE